MLSIKELQALMELLNKREETLERVEEIFLSKFKDSHAVFRASYALSNLLSLNLLNSLQRIPAIFLLIENYKNEGISCHPFGATIFQTIHQTDEAFEKLMISDIIIDSKREQVLIRLILYSKFSIQLLHERSQAMVTIVEERNQIKVLEDQFLKNLPEIQVSKKDQSEVKNVIRDYIDKEKHNQIPEHHVNLQGIKESQIGYQSFNVGFMRPIPKFIDVSHNQFHWFSPSINLDVSWDRTVEIQKRISKAKVLLKKSVNQRLTKEDSTQIETALDSQLGAVLSLDVSIEMILPMVKQNPFLVVAFLVKLSNYPIFDTYIDIFLEGDITLHTIDVVSKVVKAVRVPSQFILAFTNYMMDRVMTQKGNDRQKLVRYVIGFIKGLKKNKLINLQDIQDRLGEFLKQFSTMQEVQQLQQIKNGLLNKQ